ncbi:YqcC family protein [Testudinibacter sp. P80/BLE/0925]|uniref:YqcC family protein n=1 Tax=Testudinibacter sp. TW-1 TaxID=3417757 RepID=UPI003D35A8BE
MSNQTLLRQHLAQLQQNLVRLELWQTVAPTAARLNSEQPFHLDTLDPHEWLQWIFIPRMTALLDCGANLPNKIAVSPYIEEAMAEQEQLELLLQPLNKIEALLNDC